MRLTETARSGARKWIGPSLAVWIAQVACASSAGAQAPPCSIDRDDGLDVLNLRGKPGFDERRKIGSFAFLLDPGLADPASRCFRPARSGRDDGTRRALKDLSAFQGSREKDLERVKDWVEDVFAEFFTVVSSRQPRECKEAGDLLGRGLSAGQHALITVKVRFWGERTGEGETLACRVSLRLFRIRLDRPTEADAAVRDYLNMTRCELIFQDSAVGRVLLGAFGGRDDATKCAVKAAAIDALRDRLAVSLCANPRLRQLDVAQRPEGSLLGPPVSPR